jgi:NitT/TauT family transport system permease protein
MGRWRGWVLLGCAVIMWEVVRVAAGVSPLVMPSLVAVLKYLAGAVGTGTILRQLVVSLGVILIGAGIAVAGAAVTVFISGGNRWADDFFTVAGSLLHPLPGIALLPVVILWVGVGTWAVVLVIIHSVFWPVLTNLQAGYRSIPSAWRLVAQNYRMRPVRYHLAVVFPATLPFLLAGLRIAWARSWRALISAEMVFGAIAGGGGIGWYIFSRRVFMDAEGLFAGILVVMIAGSVVESFLFRFVEEKTVIPWGMST